MQYDTAYTWNLKYDENGLTYKIETDSPPRKEACDCHGGGSVGGGADGSLGLVDASHRLWSVYAARPAVWHGELYQYPVIHEQSRARM